MARRPHKLAVRLSDDEDAELRRRAAEHGVSMAEYVRRTALAGSALVRAPHDEWWFSKPESKRMGIFEWLRQDRGRHADVLGEPLDLDLP